MLTTAQNELLTQTDRGTPAGEMMRRFWLPVALSTDLHVDQPFPCRLLGEDLVLFRDADGAPALIERFCPHRGMDLSYGRLEDGGLRCLYHGWLFAPNGRCLEQPAEPPSSTFKDRIRHAGYPVIERNGFILAYLGPGEPPLLQVPFLACDSAQVFVIKRFHDCNYLQAMDIDPSHLSFLHRFYEDSLSITPSNKYTAQDGAPETEMEETPFGLRAYAARHTEDDMAYVRITNFVMPCGQSYVGPPLVNPKVERPLEDQGYWFHWHVPIDDTHHCKYVIAYRKDAPIDKAYQGSLFEGEVDEHYRPIRHAGNRYLQDRTEMRTKTFAGVGKSFQDQDRVAVESQGAIFNRTREHLGVSDKPVIALRKMLFEEIDKVGQGQEPRGVSRDAAVDPYADLVTLSAKIPKEDDVRGFWTREMIAP